MASVLQLTNKENRFNCQDYFGTVQFVVSSSLPSLRLAHSWGLQALPQDQGLPMWSSQEAPAQNTLCLQCVPLKDKGSFGGQPEHMDPGRLTCLILQLKQR
jgi:hypothetical protein